MNHSPIHSVRSPRPKPCRNALEQWQLALRRKTQADDDAAIHRIWRELFGPSIDPVMEAELRRLNSDGPDCREVVSEGAGDGLDESPSSLDQQTNADIGSCGDKVAPITEPRIPVVQARSGSGKWLDPSYSDGW